VRIFTEIAAPRNWPNTLVAVARPLPEFCPNNGGGYVELGDHVVVCNLGLGDDFGVTFFIVSTCRGTCVVELKIGLLVVVFAVFVGRVVVKTESDWVAKLCSGYKYL